MTQPTNADTGTLAGSLQTGPVCCKLQTDCKLESSEIRHLRQFAVCRPQFAESTCKLTKNPVTTRVSERFSVCTQSPTPSRGSRDPHAYAGGLYLSRSVGLGGWTGDLSVVGEDVSWR